MKKYFTLLFAFFITGTAHAQLSFLDPSFGSDGVVITQPPMATSFSSGGFSSVTVQPDHKIVAAGAADEYVIVARYNENGTLDSTFAVNGIFKGGPTYSGLNAIVLQPDGKILGVGRILAIRLNSNGSLDNTFGDEGIDTVFTPDNLDIDCFALALQPDGKIVVAGASNDNFVCLARLLSSGTLDSSFGTNGLYKYPYTGQANGTAIMTDGRIVVGSEASPVAFMAMRCLPDGSPDTSFNHTGVAISNAGTGGFNYCHAMQLQPDNKIVLAGAGTFGAGSSDFTLIRYNIDGSLDRSFGDTGVVNIDFDENDDEATALYLAPGGKLIVAGDAIVTYAENFSLAQINSDGSIDSGFGNNGRITTAIQDSNDFVYAVAIQTDSKIILAGYSVDTSGYRGQMTLVRYLNPSVGIKNVANTNSDQVLYPNPTFGILNIKNSLNHIVSVTVCDMQGNQIPIEINMPNHEIFITNVANGIYFVKISYDDHPPDVQKIIIQN